MTRLVWTQVLLPAWRHTTGLILALGSGSGAESVTGGRKLARHDFRGHDPEKACPGRSRPKDGVASLAYDPGWEPVFGKFMFKQTLSHRR